MTINTKFGVGDEVYIIYKIDDEVRIFKDEIKEILIGEIKTIYYGSIVGFEIKEDELVLAEDRGKVIDKIDELLKEKACEKEM